MEIQPNNIMMIYRRNLLVPWNPQVLLKGGGSGARKIHSLE